MRRTFSQNLDCGLLGLGTMRSHGVLPMFRKKTLLPSRWKIEIAGPYKNVGTRYMLIQFHISKDQNLNRQLPEQTFT